MPVSRRYPVTVRRDVRLPTGRPGVTLSADLFLPAGAGPVPLLLTLLPYRRDVAALAGSVTERWFASRGYAAMLVDLRGTGSSDGAPRPPFAAGEHDDAVAAIGWATGQPWCDGTVGMWGHSYGAMTALRTAAHRPAALRAVIALQGTADPGREFVHPGGSRGALSPLGHWSLTTLANQLLPPLDDAADPAELARWRSRLSAEPYLPDLFGHGPHDPVWTDRASDPSRVEVPVLCVAGWRDLFVDGTVAAFERAGGPARLVAGPWPHGMPQYAPHAPVDFHRLALSWWDRWLRGAPEDTADPAVTVYVQGWRPGWLGFAGWPPAGGQPVDLSGWECTRPPAPDPAVGVFGGAWSTPADPVGLTPDQHDDDARSGCHTSPPLDEPLLLCGRPSATVSGTWPRVSVKLSDVDEAGRSTLICAGLSGAAAGPVGLAPTGYRLPAGHRLRVALAPGDFPRVWPALPDGGWPELVALRLPVVTAGAVEADPPAPDPADAPAAPAVPTGAPRFEVGTDLLRDTVSMRLSGGYRTDPAAHTHRRGHRLRLRQEFVATASRTDPAAAVITGTITADVDLDTGRHVTVTATITAGPLGATASGRVVADGETLLDRAWRAGHPPEKDAP